MRALSDSWLASAVDDVLSMEQRLLCELEGVRLLRADRGDVSEL
jgi:hypothetical protein